MQLATGSAATAQAAPLDFNPECDARLFDLDLAARRGQLSDADYDAFACLLSAHTLIRLYHGTTVRHDVPGKGLLPTSVRRKVSLQSALGWVCLSYDPRRALDFARMGYPRHEAYAVYAVTVPVSSLRPDLDQLRNMRLWTDFGARIGESLAHSMIWGGGARMKGRIPPQDIRLHAAHGRAR